MWRKDLFFSITTEFGSEVIDGYKEDIGSGLCSDWS
jgi:hypothetical protein